MDLREKLKQVRGGDSAPKPKKEKIKANLNPIKYVKDSITELRKVNWPTRQEVVRGTIGVLIISIIFVVILGGSDILFQNGLSKILGDDNTNSSSQTVTPGHDAATSGSTPSVDIKNGQAQDIKGIEVKTDSADKPAPNNQ